MDACIEILAGCAGSGKTSLLLDLYRAALQEASQQVQPGKTLWLSPTGQSCTAVRERLLDDRLTACFNPNVVTFSKFAERILQASSEQILPISPLGQRVLIRRHILRLQQTGTLQHFGNIATTPGFVDQIVFLISELKRGETWPEHFEEAISCQGSHRRDRELAAIYRAYQEHLQAAALYDAEGRFWSARDRLAQGNLGPLEELSLVVVDGFTDFTHTQYEILALLAGVADRLIVTLPLESPLRRDDLFAKSRDALQRLQSCATVHVEYCRPDGLQTRPAFAQIATTLFENPREIVLSRQVEGIEILATTGQLGEVQSIALRVKQLLMEEARPGEIVVAFRSLSDYAELVEEVFSRSGIPFVAAAATPLSRLSLAKAVVSVLQLETEDWPFRRLMSLLDSNDFRPAWPELAAGVAAREVAAQLRRLKLHGGRAGILNSLARVANYDVPESSAADEREASTQKIRHSATLAHDLLRRLSETLAPLRQKQDFRAWTLAVVGISRELGFDPRLQAKPKAQHAAVRYERECRTWELLENVLLAAAGIDDYFDDAPQQIRLAEFLEQLNDLLRAASMENTTDETGKVRVVETAQMRNLDVPYLFLGGLTENGFPQRRGDDCLYSETERRELNDHGLSLGHRTSQTQDEMMLFYGVVTRARRKLVLSYPAVSSSGQPLLPSPYLSALQDLFDPSCLPVITEEDLDPVPSPDHIISTAELRVVAIDQALNKQPELLRSMSSLPECTEVGQSILAAVDAADQRFRVHGFTHFEGLIRKAEHQRLLCDRYSTDYEFSATELESYAGCPFRFFLSRVLAVRPLDSPEVATDHLRRGNLVHDILSDLHRPYDPADDAALSNDDQTAFGSPEELAARFHQLLDERMGRRVGGSDLQHALAEIERNLLEQWGSVYAEQFVEYHQQMTQNWDVPPVPVKLETTFGAATSQAQADDDATAETLVLGVSHRSVRIGGRIDRIDVGQIGVQQVFNVIDYKTGSGSGYSAKDVREGRAIQLALYTLAVQRLGIVGSAAIPFQLGYWFIKGNGYSKALAAADTTSDGVTTADVWETLQSILEESIPKLAAGIRRGDFPVFSTDPHCTTHCPYHMTCRVNQIKPLQESLHKTWEF